MELDEVVLGKSYQDVITGFKGVAIAKVQYFTGCNQVLVQPVMQGKDDKLPDSGWFDVSRLKQFGESKVKLPETATKGFDKPAPKR